MRASLVLLLAALVALPAATAHIALTVTPPAAPMPVGQTTDVDVEGAAVCSDIFVGPPPVASVTRTFELADDTPAGMNWTGDTVTWSATGCVNPTDPGNSHNSGKIYLTPDGSLPAFVDLPFEVVCDDCEDGGFTAQVGYYGLAAATTVPAVQAGVPFILMLNVSANFDTDLQLTAQAGQHSNLTVLPSTVQVDSPLSINATSRLVPLALQAGSTGAGWTTDHITLHVVPGARGHTGVVGNLTTIDLTITNPAPTSTSGSSSGTSSHANSSATGTSSHATGTSSHSGSSTGAAKKSPPASPLLALGLVACAVAWMRRRRV
jgi:hypothetical protein